MKITNLQGYMLTAPGRTLVFGDKWWPYDANVWICKDINTARQIMAESHIYVIEPVAHYETPQISMEQYLARAAAMRPHLARLMKDIDHNQYRGQR